MPGHSRTLQTLASTPLPQSLMCGLTPFPFACPSITLPDLILVPCTCCTLQTLVSRPPPHDGGNLHRQLFSGFYLTTANDIHNAMDEAINAGTPATLLRVQHTLQFLVQFKLTIDEWERAIANVRLNTTKGE